MRKLTPLLGLEPETGGMFAHHTSRNYYWHSVDIRLSSLGPARVAQCVVALVFTAMTTTTLGFCFLLKFVPHTLNLFKYPLPFLDAPPVCRFFKLQHATAPELK